MDENPLLQPISINPAVCGGKPVIRVTRIWVSLILDFMADGMSFAEILEDYPELRVEDLRAAIAFGAELTRGAWDEIVIEHTPPLKSE
jgi:uncharacterized protein (DUF433 family)